MGSVAARATTRPRSSWARSMLRPLRSHALQALAMRWRALVATSRTAGRSRPHSGASAPPTASRAAHASARQARAPTRTRAPLASKGSPTAPPFRCMVSALWTDPWPPRYAVPGLHRRAPQKASAARVASPAASPLLHLPPQQHRPKLRALPHHAASPPPSLAGLHFVRPLRVDVRPVVARPCCDVP